MTSDPPPQQTLFGHPAGLYTLFFAEMWERFSFYGMRALLVFYMIKGFLGYGDKEAYAVYGAYTALVYMTPFFGGILADRVLGARRAVVLGGALMAAGQLLLTVENTYAFFGALALLITGNGFFKPNISTIVGSLYPQQSPKRDGGFTIFYMGINLGASMSPLLCGYIGETYGWEKGFGLATVGMLTGLAVFVLPGSVARFVIMAGAMAAAGGLFYWHPSNFFSAVVNVLVGISILAAAVVAWLAIGRGGLPKSAGLLPGHAQSPPSGRAQAVIYLGALVAVPVFALLVSGLAPLTENRQPLAIVHEDTIKRLQESENGLVQVGAVVLEEVSKPAGLVLMLAGAIAFGYLGFEAFRLPRVARERMYVVLTLTFFSMLFWSFFEQAGSSVNNFTDRNVDRVFDAATVKTVAEADIGQTLKIQPTQEQLGYNNGGALFTMKHLDGLRKDHESNPEFTIDWEVAPQNIGMRVARRVDEIPASALQSVNPIYIMVFGLVFTAVWGYLGARGIEPSTPFKFALGLMQLGFGFIMFWYGAKSADARGIVSIGWLFLGYLLQTSGELCLSPVGLSMVAKLSPRHLVSTVMGGWFLATAFSQFLAAIIAQFTRVGQGSGSAAVIPVPSETVHIYGNVFGKIGVAAILSAVICFALSPLLTKWMHEGEDGPTAPDRAPTDNDGP